MGFATNKNGMKRIKFPSRDRLQTSYTAAQLAKRYGFPVVQSSHEWVAIVELCDGYPLLQSDVTKYCQAMGFAVPSVQLIPVDGASTNNPSMAGDPANGEVALDIQNVIGATGGKVGILVFFTPNTSQGFIDAIQAVANDGRACSVSISWGQEESGWPAPDMDGMDAAFQACIAKGITPFAASGDNGSSDGGSGQNADFPAASPYCIGCGGTTIGPSGEMAWSSGGGAYSTRSKQPTWQLLTAGDGNGMRAVPDMACDADPNSGYSIFLEGQGVSEGGTSAVAPMLAALTALIVAVTGKRLGLWLPECYQLGVGGAAGFTDITSGSNGQYQAKPGTDRCTGLGVPNAAMIAAVIAANSVVVPPVPVPVPPPVPVPVPIPVPPPIPVGTLRQELTPFHDFDRSLTRLSTG